MRAEIKSSVVRGRDRKEREEADGEGKKAGRYPADEPAMKPRRTRCLFLQSMEGYIHRLMAVYHARLLRSLSCVLGARAREREASLRMREREGETGNERQRERESAEEADRARYVVEGWGAGTVRHTYTYEGYARFHARLRDVRATRSNDPAGIYNGGLLIVGSLIALRTPLYARS